MGLLKPWSGSVRLGGVQEDGSKMTVGYVPQQVASFNAGFPSKVIELVRSGCYSRVGLRPVQGSRAGGARQGI
ncbi:MAG: hypothetical protein E7L01_15115 [Paenibacillus macerans]|nr:hypothetical protein [Paenibacillus macerans]MCY7558300.1 hypothetical protein [Paenibacillus macerans]MDU7474638.1 hypothetical protein [Paenibacillus macerans]MEC0137809.1 hypothetical protein [Paenibacillus macerans]MEC0150286.1 hypothetical protein [Paenibacillus macerans]